MSAVSIPTPRTRAIRANHNVRAFLYSRSRSERLRRRLLLDRADLVAHYA